MERKLRRAAGRELAKARGLKGREKATFAAQAAKALKGYESLGDALAPDPEPSRIVVPSDNPRELELGRRESGLFVPR